MHEISPDDVQHLIGDDRVLYASLTYQPRVRSFRVAKAALKRLGAVYDWKLRAWRVPASQDVLGPLERLYRASSLALYVADDGEDVTPSAFERYE
jgi:hypothetical protein